MNFFEYLYHSPELYALYVGLFGLIIGSFLNVVIYRLPIMMERQWKLDILESGVLPKGEILNTERSPFNLISPRSSCTNCQAPIKAIDNIPVISWLLLKGSCRDCGCSISVRYPAIEILSALSASIVAYNFGFSLFSLGVIFFSFTLISASVIDYDTMLLPDQLTIPLMWAGISIAVLEWSSLTVTDSVLGAISGYLSLWSVYWLFKVTTGKEGIGYGDFKLLAALGAWLGWELLPLLIVISSALGVLFSILTRLFLAKKLERLPFGPFLSISGWGLLIWGDTIQAILK